MFMLMGASFIVLTSKLEHFPAIKVMVVYQDGSCMGPKVLSGRKKRKAVFGTILSTIHGLPSWSPTSGMP